jgi:hypothetical protein
MAVTLLNISLLSFYLAISQIERVRTGLGIFLGIFFLAIAARASLEEISAKRKQSFTSHFPLYCSSKFVCKNQCAFVTRAQISMYIIPLLVGQLCLPRQAIIARPQGDGKQASKANDSVSERAAVKPSRRLSNSP